MINSDLPENEDTRFQEFHSYAVLGEVEQKEFDFLTRMAAEICEVKISLISLIADGNQWFLSRYGLEERESQKCYSFCDFAVNSPDEPFIVEDARKDKRFHDNPPVEGEPNVVFYAGIPLVNENDAAIGVLCVMDDTPRTLRKSQLQSLKLLAKQAIKLLELRRKTIRLEEKEKEVQKQQELLQIMQTVNNIGVWELDLESEKTYWSDEVYRIHEVDKDFDHNKTNGINFFHPEDRSNVSEALDKTIKTGEPFDITARLITAKDTFRWVRSTGHLYDTNGNKKALIGSLQDITELKESEQKFQGIFNSTFSFIGFLNTDGILLEVNKTALRMAGITREQVIGKPFWNCYWWQISEKTQKELKENIRKALRGEEVSYEVEVWIKDKKPITILFSLRPVFDAEGMVKFIIPEGRPIQEVVDARNRYRAVIEGTQAGTYEWNIETDEVVINERFADLLGYTVSELQPVTFKKWLQNAHPEDMEEAQRLIKKCFKKELDYFQLEMRLKHKAGHWVWISVRGKIVEWSPEGKAMKMYGTHQKITARKTMEQKLTEERTLLRTIIDSSPDSIYVKDTDGRKLIANKADCNYCGVQKEEELIGKSDFDFYPSEKARETFAIDQKVLIEGESFLNYEEVLYTSDNEPIWLLTSKFPLYKQDGSIAGLVGIGRNITDRKLAEQNREELLKRFEKLGRELPGVIYQYRLLPDESAHFPYASSGIKNIYGVTPEEVRHDATPVLKVIHPDDLDQVISSIRHSAENLTHWHNTYRVNLPSGETIWVEGKAAPQQQDDGSILWHGYIQDITEREKADHELLYKENLLEALYDLSPIGIALNDYETGSFVNVNDKLLEPSGYTKEEFLNLSYWDVTPKEYSPEEDKSLKSMEQTGRYGPYEKEYIRKDGTRYPVLLHGVVVTDLHGHKLIWSFVEDISVKKEIDRKLHEAISSLQAILDASTQVSIIASDTTGVINLFNKGAEKMLDYSAEEIIGRHTPEIFHLSEEIEQEAKLLSKEFGRTVEGYDVFVERAKEGTAYTKQWTYKRKDGSTYPILLSVTAIRREKEITGYLGVAADISQLETARKELNLLLQITQEQNERLKNFAHIVTHNLRSHSAGISGMLELIKLENPETYANEYIQHLEKGAENLKETIHNLSETAKHGFTESDNFRSIKLKNEVERNIHSLLSAANKSNVKIINEVESHIELRVIPAYLDSIIMNLLTNAIKYSDSNKDSYARVYADISDSEYTLIAFEDNGLGINLDKHGDKIFGIYSTFHKHEDSRGVGLFITKNQIESMGGYIKVESEAEKGTTFKVYLPNPRE